MISHSFFDRRLPEYMIGQRETLLRFDRIMLRAALWECNLGFSDHRSVEASSNSCSRGSHVSNVKCDRFRYIESCKVALNVSLLCNEIGSEQTWENKYLVVRIFLGTGRFIFFLVLIIITCIVYNVFQRKFQVSLIRWNDLRLTLITCNYLQKVLKSLRLFRFPVWEKVIIYRFISDHSDRSMFCLMWISWVVM